MSSANEPDNMDTISSVPNVEDRNNSTLTDNPPDISTIEAAPIFASGEDPLNVAANESEIM